MGRSRVGCRRRNRHRQPWSRRALRGARAMRPRADDRRAPFPGNAGLGHHGARIVAYRERAILINEAPLRFFNRVRPLIAHEQSQKTKNNGDEKLGRPHARLYAQVARRMMTPGPDQSMCLTTIPLLSGGGPWPKKRQARQLRPLRRCNIEIGTRHASLRANLYRECDTESRPSRRRSERASS